MFSRILAAVLAGLLLIAAPAGLRAADEPEIIRLVLDRFEKQFKYRPTYDSLEETSSSIIMHNLNLVPPSTVAKGKDTVFRIRTITLSRPTLDDGGMYHIGEVLLEGGLLEGKDDKGEKTRISMPLAVAREVTCLPPAAARTEVEKFVAGNLLFSSLRVDEISIETADAPKVSLSGLRMTWKGDRRTSQGEGMFDLGRLVIPPAIMKKLDKKGSFSGLGYEGATFTFTMRAKNAWDEKNVHHMDIAIRFGMEQAGQHETAIEDLAMPLAFLQNLKELGEREKEAGKVNEQEWLDAMQKAAANITVRGARISWIDHSLTGRLLDFYGKQQGQTREALVENLAAYPQILLMQFGLPELAARATPEIRKFLKDPRSLSVSFRAKAPMSIATMMTLFSDPAGLVDALGVQVEANTLK